MQLNNSRKSYSSFDVLNTFTALLLYYIIVLGNPSKKSVENSTLGFDPDPPYGQKCGKFSIFFSKIFSTFFLTGSLNNQYWFGKKIENSEEQFITKKRICSFCPLLFIIHQQNKSIKYVIRKTHIIIYKSYCFLKSLNII